MCALPIVKPFHLVPVFKEGLVLLDPWTAGEVLGLRKVLLGEFMSLVDEYDEFIPSKGSLVTRDGSLQKGTAKGQLSITEAREV